jgi:hypothetical protein
MPRPGINGVRMHVILTQTQITSLQKQSRLTGLTVAEQMRRAVDFYLAKVAERTTKKP